MSLRKNYQQIVLLAPYGVAKKIYKNFLKIAEFPYTKIWCTRYSVVDKFGKQVIRRNKEFLFKTTGQRIMILWTWKDKKELYNISI